MPFAPYIPVSLELQERLRVAYYEEKKRPEEAAAIAEVSVTTFYRWLKAWDWPLRKPMLSRAKDRSAQPRLVAGEGAPRTAAPSAGPAAATTPQARLRRLLEHRLTVLEHEAMTGTAVNPEANARALALNARTLAQLAKLGEGAGAARPEEDERPARSLNELRDDLWAHFERIRGERQEPCVEAAAAQAGALGRTPSVGAPDGDAGEEAR